MICGFVCKVFNFFDCFGKRKKNFKHTFNSNKWQRSESKPKVGKTGGKANSINKTRVCIIVCVCGGCKRSSNRTPGMNVL